VTKKKSTNGTGEDKPNPQAHWTREHATFDALCAAYAVVQSEAVGRNSPIARDAAKILETLVAAVRVNDEFALREGTKWARAHGAAGGKAPRVELVRTLYGIVKARRCCHIRAEDHYTGCELDGVALDASVKVAVSGLVTCAGRPDGPEGSLPLAKRIRDALGRREGLQLADDELMVKDILMAAGLDESKASNWLKAARL
jgi:hypothetical protein